MCSTSHTVPAVHVAGSMPLPVAHVMLRMPSGKAPVSKLGPPPADVIAGILGVLHRQHVGPLLILPAAVRLQQEHTSRVRHDRPGLECMTRKMHACSPAGPLAYLTLEKKRPPSESERPT